MFNDYPGSAGRPRPRLNAPGLSVKMGTLESADPGRTLQMQLSRIQKLLIGLCIAGVISGGLVRLVRSSDWYARRSARTTAMAVARNEPVRVLTVDVDGAVREPGVYRLPAGATYGDAVSEAGGRARDADTRCVNLTGTVRDKQKIYIPHRSENACPRTTLQDLPSISDSPEAAADTDLSPSPGGAPAPADPAPPAADQEPHIVNINTAGATELDSLPGIGPTYAQRIVELRASRGPFRTIEEIMLVKGIGESTYEKIRHLIRVED